jgi:hypothetical protein
MLNFIDYLKMKKMKGKYLVTTDNWFYAPDGKKYKAAWGEVNVAEDSILGVKTNRNSSNWFLCVGGGDREIIIAGCQVHYAIKCINTPSINSVRDISYGSGGTHSFERPTEIYIAE